jgi:hypothetical protein
MFFILSGPRKMRFIYIVNAVLIAAPQGKAILRGEIA